MSESGNSFPRDEIELLLREWEVLDKSVQWNYDIFEKQRNALFVAIAGLFGLSGAKFSGAESVWVVVPPVVTILLYRMLGQMYNVSWKGFRCAQIELEIESILDSRKFWRIHHSQERIYHSLGNPYASTYLLTALFCAGVICFSAWKGGEFLGEFSVWWKVAFLLFTGFSCIWFGVQVILFLRDRQSRLLVSVADAVSQASPD